MSNDIAELIKIQKLEDPTFAWKYEEASRLLTQGRISEAQFHTAVSAWILDSIAKEVY